MSRVDADSYYGGSAVYSIAQAQKAINPKDVDGPFGQRIASTVSGDLDWALLATAYVTNRNSASDWPRYSLVVLNWSVRTPCIISGLSPKSQPSFFHRDDSASTTWNPQPVTATLEFRGTYVSQTLVPVLFRFEGDV